LQTTDQRIDALTGEVSALTRTVNQINQRAASMQGQLATLQSDLQVMDNQVLRNVSVLYAGHRLTGLVVCLYMHDIMGQGCLTGT
jgi:septal ring factor EnvC (AmiA/AmiB activator)